jgi:uncharacterized protein YbbC (DUF1343 family)
MAMRNFRSFFTNLLRFKISWSHLALIVFLIPELALSENATQESILTGAEQPTLYLSKLKNKKIALVVNQTSVIGNKHLVDFLLSKQITVKKIFAPEHGFRGEAGAGEMVQNSKDPATGIPIISIYGKNRKPDPQQLDDIDLVIFDIQDVGCRFYTYISTLHYIMEVCGETNKRLLILDRPNPNGDYIDGPVMRPPFTSFVGMDPIPVVHGCTIGELAQMINGERWLAKGVQAPVEIIKVANYTHGMKYEPPVRPSPNLPNYLAIRLYPSLCFFEATSVSVGRGTQFPFQVLGYPDPSFGNFSFTPQPLKGMELNPLQKDKLCYGEDLRKSTDNQRFTLIFFIDWLHKFKSREEFVTRASWFNQLMGNDVVLKLIYEGKGESEIRKSWEDELAGYAAIRRHYLLYPDFKH